MLFAELTDMLAKLTDMLANVRLDGSKPKR
jgi:hypothetical protein